MTKVNLGSFGVIGGQILIFTKMHYLFYVTKYIHVIHTLASHFRDKQGNWGQSGVKVLKPTGYGVCDGNMSSYLAAFGGKVLFSSCFFLLLLLLLLLLLATLLRLITSTFLD